MANMQKHSDDGRRATRTLFPDCFNEMRQVAENRIKAEDLFRMWMEVDQQAANGIMGMLGQLMFVSGAMANPHSAPHMPTSYVPKHRCNNHQEIFRIITISCHLWHSMQLHYLLVQSIEQLHYYACTWQSRAAHHSGDSTSEQLQEPATSHQTSNRKLFHSF